MLILLAFFACPQPQTGDTGTATVRVTDTAVAPPPFAPPLDASSPPVAAP